MVNFLVDITTSFILGLLTPTTAACVLPLYPGFLVYLTAALGEKSNKKRLATFGLVISSGVVVFMLLLGLIFSTILQVSLTNVIGIVSPIAFFILLIISLLLIFDIDIGSKLPRIATPRTKNPLAHAFIYGFFFGAIVVPCNPAFIAAMLARTAAVMNFIANVFNFLAFGVGMAAPLIAFSLLSTTKTQSIITFLAKNTRKINLASGLIMLGVSVYYLVFVFRVLG
ncbi:MAG: cytochrome C biogenesis protein [DPANN group archaeon]|nr:cytochrome C biogenesis protein [DPANN group archaeon]